MRQDDVPHDVLEQIFYIHVYTNFQSRLSLLQTCHQWYKVAINYASLWRTISWNSDDQLPPFRVYCQNIDALAHTVNRVGTATFDLRLGCPYDDPSEEDIQRFTSSVPQNWPSRCHSLSLYAPEERWRVQDATTLGDLLGTYSYDALERLELIQTGTKMWEHMLHTLMIRVESTSPGLRSLKISLDRERTHIVKCVLERPAILKRLRSLDIRYLRRSVPWADLPELEDLSFCDTVDDDMPLNDLCSRKLRKLTLGGRFRSLHLPQGICQQLTHLTLKGLDLRNPFEVTLLKFPSLVSFGLKATRFELKDIEAPNLEDFMYQFDPIVGTPYQYPYFGNTTLTPRVTRLDILADELDHAPFALKLNVWSEVEELHLTIYRSHDDIGSTLTDALSRTTHQQPFPSLKKFTVLHPADRDGSVAPERKLKHVKNLQKIAQNRRDSGWKDLEKLEVGWYSTNGNEFVIKDQSREWWVIVWKDCDKSTSRFWGSWHSTTGN